MASSPGTQTKPIRHENGINDQPKVLICHSSGAMAEVRTSGRSCMYQICINGIFLCCFAGVLAWRNIDLIQKLSR